MIALSIATAVAIGCLAVFFGRRSGVLAPTVLVLLSQCALSLIIYDRFGLRGDEIIYDFQAKLFAERLQLGIWDPPTLFVLGRGSYLYFVSLFHVINGGVTAVALLGSSTVVGFIPGLLARSCRNFDIPGAARASAWLVSFSPALIIWTPGIRRESLVFTLLAFLLLSLSLIFRGKWISGVLLWFVSAIAIYLTRYQLVWLMAAPGVVVAMAMSAVRRRAWAMSLWIVPATLIGAGLTLLLSLASIRILSERGFLDLGGRLESLTLTGSTTLVPNVSWTSNLTPQNFAFNSFRSLVGPPFWEWNSFAMVLFGVEGMVYFIVVLAALLTVIFHPEVRLQAVVLVYTVLPLAAINAAYLVVYGLNSRLRAHYVIFLLPLFAYGLHQFYVAIRSRFNGQAEQDQSECDGKEGSSP